MVDNANPAHESDAMAEANLCAHLALLPGAQVVDTGDTLRIATPVPHGYCNPVFARNLPTGSALDARIDETRAYFRARGTPHRWYVTPRTGPVDVGSAFLARGFTGRETGNMTLDLSTLDPSRPPPDGCAVDEVSDAADWLAWRCAFEAGYGLPAALADGLLNALSAVPAGRGAPVRHFLARQAGAAVATATLVHAAGAAGVYWVATVPPARGRGVGAAITSEALRVGRALGATVGVLQPSPMGASVYRRLGFVDGPVWLCFEEPATPGVTG